MIFLKLGGSLITDKDAAVTPRMDVITRTASEIARFLDDEPDARLLVGHGSGSFGHETAARHGTHKGAQTEADWHGFAEVWAAAQQLNRVVVDALRHQGLAALTLSPSASALTEDGRLVELAVQPVKRALAIGLLPVVHGDVAFDRVQGASIISTEEVFRYLAEQLSPLRILLAGAEPGVFADYPHREQLLPQLSSDELDDLTLLAAQGPDVTGGMAGKVRQSIELAERMPGLEIRIFSGQEEGAIYSCLHGQAAGTRIRASGTE